jgi:hypothetical protein
MHCQEKRIYSVTMKVQAGSNPLGSNLTYTMIEWAMQANVTWLYWVDTSASALTRFIRYIYYWNLQFLNNVIIIKSTVHLLQV